MTISFHRTATRHIAVVTVFCTRTFEGTGKDTCVIRLTLLQEVHDTIEGGVHLDDVLAVRVLLGVLGERFLLGLEIVAVEATLDLVT